MQGRRLTRQEIEHLRWSLRANLPNEFNENIDALCDMALLSLEDKESGAGRVCADAKSDMTPCVIKDGDCARDDNGECVGCGKLVVDLDANAWNRIKEAASKSPWIPPEYYMNDWVSDVCRFLLTPEEYQDKSPPPPAHRWVPVSERLPDNGDTVLAFWPPMLGGVPTGQSWGVATYADYWHNPEDDMDEYAKPNAWIPLPAAPSSGKEGQ